MYIVTTRMRCVIMSQHVTKTKRKSEFLMSFTPAVKGLDRSTCRKDFSEELVQLGKISYLNPAVTSVDLTRN